MDTHSYGISGMVNGSSGLMEITVLVSQIPLTASFLIPMKEIHEHEVGVSPVWILELLDLGTLLVK